ncbi:MAG: tripartite tricarboxylate transporter substrate binding protein [Betaproteobacteria bacterium]|jgi:tripartite-type tricarboxylate transporter receptor subunit TctC
MKKSHSHSTMRILIAEALLLLPLLTLSASPVGAQPYPHRALRVVVPYPPGGPTDIIGRAIAQKLSGQFAQSVIVDNRPGAAGTIGAEQVARAPGDGYTLLWGTPGTHAIAPSLYPKLPYDPVKDFSPVTLVALGTNVLVIHPSVPASSVKEFIALARSRPGKLSFSSAGSGATSHMAGEMLKVMSGIDMLHVPFKGASPAIIALLSGQVDAAILDIPALLPHIRSGKLRALAVASEHRSTVLAQLPTLRESGLPQYSASSWHGLFAPANIAPEIVSTLFQSTKKILMLPDINEKLTTQGVEPVGNTPAEFTLFLREETLRWAQVAKLSHARVD